MSIIDIVKEQLVGRKIKLYKYVLPPDPFGTEKEDIIRFSIESSKSYGSCRFESKEETYGKIINVRVASSYGPSSIILEFDQPTPFIEIWNCTDEFELLKDEEK